MRKSFVRLSSEFSTKSHSSAWQPKTRYGMGFMPWGHARQNWMRPLNWVTKDSNRLINYAARYQHVIDQLDVKRNEEELQIPLAEVRWHDHRKVFFKCPCCGSSFQQYVSSAVKYGTMCKRCNHRYPSSTRGAESLVDTAGKPLPTLESAYPDLCEQLADGEGVRTFPTSSPFSAQWKCRKCEKPYAASIRCRTGEVHPGEPPMGADPRFYDCCPNCSWNENFSPLGKKILREGSFLGLEPELVSSSSSASSLGSTKKASAGAS